MINDGANGAAVARYVIEMDGKKLSEHVHFVDAIKEGLVLRGQWPHSNIKVRDLSQTSSAEGNAEIAA